MTKTDETTQTESCNLIVCEILCYVQNKMDNINYIVKTVADFYNESDIHTAKTMLFGCCKDTALRFKSYRMDGGFCPGGFCPGGVLSGGVLSGGFCPGGGFVRGVLSGGFCPGGFCPREGFVQRGIVRGVLSRGVLS